MTRTPKQEAQRRLTQARTWYTHLQEKNRKAEADYRDKIAYLETLVEEETQKESAK